MTSIAEAEPQEANGNGWKGLLGAIAKGGAMAVLALILVLFLMNNVSNNMQQMTTDINQLKYDGQTHAKTTEEQLKSLAWYLRVICTNTANTQGERLDCVR